MLNAEPETRRRRRQEYCLGFTSTSTEPLGIILNVYDCVCTDCAVLGAGTFSIGACGLCIFVDERIDGWIHMGGRKDEIGWMDGCRDR